MCNSTSITVIMPIYNEEKHIANALECIIMQDWQGDIEILVVDGKSTDNSVNIINEISKNLPKNRKIKVLSNPQKYIPVSLNIACENASNEIIVRIDGHTYAPLDYVSESMKVLKAINYEGIVGGRCVISPSSDSKIAKAISIGVSNKFGVGNALYRTFNDNNLSYLDVDTVPFGAFSKKVWKKLGGYDEVLLYDEDYDFNYRAIKNGYRVVMNPKIELNYFSRKNLKLLWKQYFGYGYWANKFCIKHRIIPSYRRLVPLVFVLSLLISPLISKYLFYGITTLYLSVMIAISINEGLIKKRNFLLAIALIPVFPTLHLSYGIGNVLSVVTGIKDIFFKSGKKNF